MKKITRYVDHLRIRNSPAQLGARHQAQVSLPYSSTAPPSPPLPTHPGSPTLTNSRSKGSLITHARRWIGKKFRRRCMSFAVLPVTLLTDSMRCTVGLVDMLPDDALLVIFDFCAHQLGGWKEDIEAWQILVHVCRRWRILVFASPRRLNLRLICAANTPARDALDVWPNLPLIIQCDLIRIGHIDNIVAVLERNNRVCQISLPEVSSSELEKVSAAMQVPFPELTRLILSSKEKPVAVLPDSFLGGSGPRLQYISFYGIPFPGLPKLLLSATHLADLRLFNIPHSGYIPPEEMVTILSTLLSLGHLLLQFQSPRSCPDRESRRPPPQSRFVLPVLRHFQFKGATEYLDDLVACIDAPRLDNFGIEFFNDIVFDTPQLIEFISRTPTLLDALDSADVSFGGLVPGASVRFSSEHFQRIDVHISCGGLDWQVSSVEQVCTSCLPFIFTLETLYITAGQYGRPEQNDNVENTQWLELLHPFTAVKKLYLSEEVARRFVPALKELEGGSTTEVLPALENIFLEGSVLEGIGQFAVTRQVAGHSIAVSRWEHSPNPSPSLETLMPKNGFQVVYD